jgi:hypothetical protein
VAAKSELLDATADKIRTVLTDVDWDFQVEPRMVLNPSGACIDMYPGDPATDFEVASFAGVLEDMAAGFIFNVRARVSPNDHEAGQEILLELGDPASDLSLVQALYDDPTLSGTASDVNLTSESGFTVFTDIDPSKVYLGVLWRFLVIPARS